MERIRAITILKPPKTTEAWASTFWMLLKIHSNNHNNTTIWYSFSSNNNFHNNKEETWIIQSLKTEATCYLINRGRLSPGVVPLDKASRHQIKIIKIRGTSLIAKTFHREWWRRLWTVTITTSHLVPTSPELNLANKVDQTISQMVETHRKKIRPVNYWKIMNK
jgi:hypothetical protein